jgi:hypothetical protein
MEMSTSTFFADQQRLQLDLQDVSARTLARIFEVRIFIYANIFSLDVIMIYKGTWESDQ